MGSVTDCHNKDKEMTKYLSEVGEGDEGEGKEDEVDDDVK